MIVLTPFTISVTAWLKNKVITTTSNLAYGVDPKKIHLSDNIAYVSTTASGDKTNELSGYEYVSTNIRNDLSK